MNGWADGFPCISKLRRCKLRIRWNAANSILHIVRKGLRPNTCVFSQIPNIIIPINQIPGQARVGLLYCPRQAAVGGARNAENCRSRRQFFLPKERIKNRGRIKCDPCYSNSSIQMNCLLISLRRWFLHGMERSSSSPSSGDSIRCRLESG